MFPSNWTPRLFPETLAEPPMWLLVHAGSPGLASSSPTTTSDVVPPIVSLAVVAPQIRMATAPDDAIPLVVAPSTSSAPPPCTFRGPLTTAPGAIKIDSPEETVNKATVPVMFVGYPTLGLP